MLMSSLFLPVCTPRRPPPPAPKHHRETPLEKSTALFSSTAGDSSWRVFSSPPLIFRRRTCSSPQSATLSKTRAGLKGLTAALFSPTGECTRSAISPKTNACRRACSSMTSLMCFTVKLNTLLSLPPIISRFSWRDLCI